MTGNNPRRQPRVAIVSLLLATFLGSANAYGGEVSTNKFCYEFDEDIIIAFEIDDPGTDDWIGIYPADMVSGELEPSMWVSHSERSCYHRFCLEPKHLCSFFCSFGPVEHKDAGVKQIRDASLLVVVQ